MMKPTIGRQVWFTPGAEPTIASNALSDQPFAATVVHVNDDDTVNLAVLDHFGKAHFVRDCPLSQEDGDVDATKDHCAWMPYQKSVQRAENAAIDAKTINSSTAGLKAEK